MTNDSAVVEIERAPAPAKAKKMDLRSVRIDLEKQKLGVWVPWLDGGRLRIGRTNSLEFQRRENELLEQLEEREKKRPTEQQIRDVRTRAMSELVLLGWEDIEDGGVPLPAWSPSEAFKLLADPELERLRVFVWIMGANDSLFLKAIEDVEGN